MEKNLSELLASYPELQCTSCNKIRCSLTGHEMPSNFDAVLHFVQGSKFQRMRRLQEQLQKNQAYLEDRGTHVYCKLTKRSVSKVGEAVERHINGRRFRNALLKAQSDENGNRMETSPSGDVDSPQEPRLIDDSDEDDIVCNRHNEDDSSSSSSSIGDLEAVDNGELYPELAFSDNGGGGDSDYDFNAMDTDLDAETSTKRKVDTNSSDTPANKRRRC